MISFAYNHELLKSFIVLRNFAQNVAMTILSIFAYVKLKLKVTLKFRAKIKE